MISHLIFFLFTNVAIPSQSLWFGSRDAMHQHNCAVFFSEDNMEYDKANPRRQEHCSPIRNDSDLFDVKKAMRTQLIFPIATAAR